MVNFKVLKNYVQSEILMITAVKEELEYRRAARICRENPLQSAAPDGSGRIL